MTAHVAVVGGGVSGLTAAYRLKPWVDAGALDVDLFEAGPRLGGVIHSEHPLGTVLEGGPDSLLRRKPAAEQLCRQLGLGDELIGINPRIAGAYIYHAHRFHPIPAGTLAGVPTDWGPLWRSDLFSLPGKVRAGADLVLPKSAGGGDRGLGMFLRRRFGREVVDRLVEPMLSGIYAGDANALSLLATFPQLLEMETRHRSLLLAGRALRRSRRTPSARESPFRTLKSGVQTLIDALGASLPPDSVHCNRPVRSASARAGRWELEFDGERRDFDAVIVATPAYRAGDLLMSLDRVLGEELSAILYTSLAVVGLLYQPGDIPRPLDKTGFLVPKGEGVAMTACTWVGAKWDYPEPQPYAAMRVFLGRSGEDVLQSSDDRLLEQALSDLRQTMEIVAPPVHARVFRQPRAMPQYRVGHLDRVARITERLAHLPGLYLTGAAYDGVGIPDCIRHAGDTAARLARELGAAP